jgi:hypothetical protein
MVLTLKPLPSARTAYVPHGRSAGSASGLSCLTTGQAGGYRTSQVADDAESRQRAIVAHNVRGVPADQGPPPYEELAALVVSLRRELADAQAAPACCRSILSVLTGGLGLRIFSSDPPVRRARVLDGWRLLAQL